MGLGFRARLEGMHDVMHLYFGDYNYWNINGLKFDDVSAEIGVPTQSSVGTMNYV